MRYSPSELFDKLSSKGVLLGHEDNLRSKCTEVRENRKKSPEKKEPAINYLPEVDYIKKGRPLHEIPKAYTKDVLNFLGYISDTAKRTFHIKMINTLSGELKTLIKPYVHRWTDIYKSGVLAKMYQLEAYYGDNIQDVEFITLTTYQRGLTYEEALTNLSKGREKLLSLLRWRYGTNDYVWVFEPHESGFAHLHMVYFRALSPSDRESLSSIWHDKYELGSKEHGLYFSPPRASSDGVFLSGSIAHIRSYLMKYISKGLYSDSEYKYEFHGKEVPFSMSLKELLFNAILKKTKTRLWGCSRNLSQIMKRPEEPGSEEWECIEVDQYYGDSVDDGFNVLWTKEHGLRPSFIWMWKEFCSWTTEPLKELYEKHGYKIEFEPFRDKNKWVAYERVCVPVECA